LAENVSEDERILFDSANRERIALHLRPLTRDLALAKAARQHALLMAKENILEHQLPGELPLAQRASQAGAHFSRVGENIALGPQAAVIHTGWMHSPGHRANILDVHFTSLGVAVVEGHGGELYAVEDFSAAVAALSIEEQEDKVAALLSAKGLQVTAENKLARELCAGELAPAARKPMLIFSFEAPDISKLPEPLEKKIRESKYLQAAVGACQPKESASGIARFRIAVLLFGAPAGNRK
jgi:hypothetical protein